MSTTNIRFSLPSRINRPSNEGLPSKFFTANGSFPKSACNTASCGTTTVMQLATGAATAGKYVSAITVTNGTIKIAYGGSLANASIPATAVLFLTPYLDNNGDVIWVCGYQINPTGTTLGNGVSVGTTTVAVQYLPTGCHT